MAKGSGASALTGRRILVVEDEYFLADDLKHTLAGHGAEVIGPVGTLEAADRLVGRGGVDCAVLDINLRGEMAFPVADRLREAGIPFLIATGYGGSAMPERFRDVPHLQKPFEPGRLLELLPKAIGAAQG